MLLPTRLREIALYLGHLLLGIQHIEVGAYANLKAELGGSQLRFR